MHYRAHESSKSALDTGYPKAAMALSLLRVSRGCCKSDGARRDIQELNRVLFIRVHTISLHMSTIGYTSWLSKFNKKVTRVLSKVWFFEEVLKVLGLASR